MASSSKDGGGGGCGGCEACVAIKLWYNLANAWAECFNGGREGSGCKGYGIHAISRTYSTTGWIAGVIHRMCFSPYVRFSLLFVVCYMCIIRMCV